MAKKKNGNAVAETTSPETQTAVATAPESTIETAATPATPATPDVSPVTNSPADTADTVVTTSPNMPVVMKNDPNAFFVTEDMLDTTHFKNPRGKITDSAIKYMRESLVADGQIQNITTGKVLSTGKFPVCAGWTRTEAIRHLVYMPLISRFNKENNLKSADAGFLLVTNPKHREIVAKLYPEDVAKARDKYKLKIVTDNDIITPADAFRKSMTENNVRTDMPLYFLFQSTETSVTEFQLKAKDVAASLGKSEGAISQYRKMNRLPGFLRDMLVTPEEGEKISESDLVKLKEDVVALVDELERRMQLERNDPLGVSFSHLQQYTYYVMVESAQNAPVEGKLPKLTRAQALEFLCRMIGADPATRKINEKAEPETYNAWLARMKAAEEATKKLREIKASGDQAAAVGDGTQTTTAPATPTQAQIEGAATGTVAGLAAAQADAVTPVSGADQAAALNAGVTVAPAPASTQSTTPLPATTPAVTSADATMAAALSVTPEELALAQQSSGTAATPASEASTALTGQKKAKTQVAGDDRVKLKSADLILAAAQQMANLASAPVSEDEPRSSFGTAGAAASAAVLYQALGMDDLYLKWNEAAVNYQEQMEQYLDQLEMWAEGVFHKHKTSRPPAELHRPQFVIEGMEDEAALLGDDDFAEPSDDELRNVTNEDLTDDNGIDDETAAEMEDEELAEAQRLLGGN